MQVWTNTMYGYEVSGMILLHDLKGAMWLDHSKDICACFNLRQLHFQCLNTSCVEVVALMRRMFLCLIIKISD
jgi:hypothetical protein